ncbi:MAG: B12-binding domain-containing radical SAM protein [Deltaproteobacteria bacterium]|nr:B12-binding domain-containing radical SAM protein [Deltaproteobacteria bacterium]
MSTLDAIFIGAEYEENLSSRTMASVARHEGFSSGILGFNTDRETPIVLASILEARPALVGLSMAFQHRALEFLRLADALRNEGYDGHIVVGGHFPTATASEVIRRHSCVDTVISFDGERPLAMLLARLDAPARWAEVPALTFRDASGDVRSTPPEPVPRDLDSLPLPIRDDPLTPHMGQPFTTLCGSRGCYGNCSFCAINSYHRGRPGPRLRFRTPESIAREMASLYHEKGARIFCFHDDTFFLPNKGRMRARMDELADRLDALGVTGRFALVAKARPDALDPGLLAHLRERIGLMRLYIGVENFSRAGLEHLNRRVDREQVDLSLSSCATSGVYGCYNLLIFEPDARLEDMDENLAGMRKFSSIPVNFCRAEAYNGTALHTMLQKQGRLRGNYLASDYDIADSRMEMLFRIVYQAFKDRNFASDALANLNMSLGYELQLLLHFCEPDPDLSEAEAETNAMMKRINENSLERLTEAVEFVRKGHWKDPRGCMDFTVELAQKVNFQGAELHTQVLDLRRHLQDLSMRLLSAEPSGETSSQQAAMKES